MKKLCVLLLAAVALVGCSTHKNVAQPSEQKSIVIIYENDVHGNIGGYAKLAGLRDAIAQSDTAWAAVVSCGDYLSGGVACSLNKGEYITEIMNSVHYDAITLGNHEYDFGVPRLLELLPKMNTSVVCSNLFTYGGHTPLLPSYVIKTYGKKRVAFVGVSTPESMLSESYSFFDSEGHQLYDMRTDEVYQLVQDATDEARRKGADYVVLLAHLGEVNAETGIGSAGLVAATRGIDAVLDGHTHETIVRHDLPNIDGKPVPVTQTGTQFANYGKLVIAPNGHIITSLVAKADNSFSSSKVEATVDEVNKRIDMEVSRELCTVQFELTINDADGNRLVRKGETNLGDLATDAYRKAMKADIGLQNGGGLRNSIKAGVVTMGDVINALPFENYIVKLEATGAQIVETLQAHIAQLPAEDGSFLQVSGMRYTVHSRSHTVTDVEVFDAATGTYQPIDLSRRYTIGTIDYTYKGHILTGATLLETSAQLYANCVADYFGSLTSAELDAYEKAQGRITIIE